jgi:hypothetical protein
VLLYSVALSLSPDLILHARQNTPSDSNGILHPIEVNQSDYFAVINEDFSNPVAISGADSIKLSPGIYTIRLIKKSHKDVAFRTRIEQNTLKEYRFDFSRLRIDEPDGDKTSSSYPRLELQAKNAIRTDFDTSIFIDGEYIGKGFATVPPTNSFKARLKLKAQSGEEIEKEILLNGMRPFQLHEHFIRPRQSLSIIYSIVPGASQIYKKQYFKAGAIIGSQLALAFSAFYYDNQMNQSYRDLKVAKVSYTNSTDPYKVLALAEEMETLDNKMDQSYKLRNTLITASIALYAYNVLDGIFKTDDGYRRNVSFDPYLDIPERSASIKLSVTF